MSVSTGLRPPKGLYLRFNTWWLRWTPGPGLPQVREPLGTSDLVEAVAAADKIRLREGPKHREAAGACDAEIARYIAAMRAEGLAKSTLESRAYVLKGFVKELDVATPRYISPSACQKWFDQRLQAHAYTAVSYLNQVRWWFEWLIDRGSLSRDPTVGIKVPKLKMRSRKVFLLPAAARKIIDDCDDDDLKFALYCGVQAGFRKLEVVEALPEWFDLDARLIHIQPTPTFQPKDRECRTIPMSDEFHDWLRDHYGIRSPFMLMPEVKHGKYRYRYDFRAAYDKHKKACGISVTFHDLRRTFASLLVSEGKSLYKVAKWLGDTLKVVENTYGHLVPPDDEINAGWHKKKEKPKTVKKAARKAA